MRHSKRKGETINLRQKEYDSGHVDSKEKKEKFRPFFLFPFSKVVQIQLETQII